MKKELYPGYEISYKKFDDVKIDGFLCSLYISEPFYLRGKENLSYSAYIVPLRYKGNKVRYPIYLRCSLTEKEHPECLIEDKQIERLIQISEYDGFMSVEMLKKRLYQGFFNLSNQLMKYSKKHFALHCKLHGVQRISI